MNLRAFYAVALACALVFALVASGFGAARAHAPFGPRTGVSCHAGDSLAASTTKTPPRSEHFACPDCCLIAFAGPAMAAERPAGLLIAPRLVWAAVAYAPPSEGRPDAPPVASVNGARAPPLFAISI